MVERMAALTGAVLGEEVVYETERDEVDSKKWGKDDADLTAYQQQCNLRNGSKGSIELDHRDTVRSRC
jgi:hypothetical protein